MEGETPSAYSFASARALARLAAAMANKGSFEGTKILSEQGWNDLHANPKLIVNETGAERTNLTQGGLNRYFIEDWDTPNDFEKGVYSNRNGFYGWMGLGGSVFQWNPQHKIGFSYVMKNAFKYDLYNGRGALL